jgi:hypothetical protein
MAAPQPASCRAKEELLLSYQKTTAAFSAAVTLLQQKMGVVPKAEYDRLSIAADEARIRSEHARLVLEQHVAEHHC